MEAKLGLNEKLDAVLEALDEDKKRKEKKFKLPFSVKAGHKAKIKKGWILVFIIKNNGNITPRYVPVEDQMIYLKDNKTYHLASSEYLGYYGQHPVIFLYENSLEPLVLNKLMEDTVKEKKLADPQRVIINAMELAAARLKGGSSLFGKSIIWLIVLGVVVAYIAYTSLTGNPP